MRSIEAHNEHEDLDPEELDKKRQQFAAKRRNTEKDEFPKGIPLKLEDEEADLNPLN